MIRRVVVRDPTLPHQIVLNFTNGRRNQHGLIEVSCNCRSSRKGTRHDPIVVLRPELGVAPMLAAYRDPAAHVSPFDPRVPTPDEAEGVAHSPA